MESVGESKPMTSEVSGVSPCDTSFTEVPISKSSQHGSGAGGKGREKDDDERSEVSSLERLVPEGWYLNW